MFCSNCGAKLEEGTWTCPQCFVDAPRPGFFAWLGRFLFGSRLPVQFTFDKSIVKLDGEGKVLSADELPPEVRTALAKGRLKTGTKMVFNVGVSAGSPELQKLLNEVKHSHKPGEHSLTFSYRGPDGRHEVFHSPEAMPPQVRALFDSLTSKGFGELAKNMTEVADSPLETTKFVYVTYISTTPDKLWSALIDPEMVKQYWSHHRNVSDWQAGSRWERQDYDDATLVDVAGQVVESTPPRRLVCTWSVPGDAANPPNKSLVAFDIEPVDDSVRLTLTHDELETDSQMLKELSASWPLVLSSLKTLLETGRPLESTTRRWKAG